MPDKPGTPPITLLALITDAYTDALMRLAYAERDRHDWTAYRKLGHDLIGVGARVIMHAYARREAATDDPRAAAEEAVRELRTTLRLAEQVTVNPVSADSVAREVEAFAEDCAQAAGQLYRISAGLSPAAIAEINPLGPDHDTVTDAAERAEHPGGGPR
ncbi:hypothetical protein [Amycolatopsis sp. Hca4]|uniref:hypothetical protein n=1 Tax=Amycolatopsis sp. Hca4 TaxID=2742131 RepID=UPI001590EDAA|nr:hypothetical protein [Amycolatopsis sp. Hca4]QKV74167.1 hypothetical protein HUT10_10625 [Amycolatopsis sp. Hca4]